MAAAGVQGAVGAQVGAEEAEPLALHERPHLNHVVLLELHRRTKSRYPHPLTIVSWLLSHRDIRSSLAPVARSTSFTLSPPCTFPCFLGSLVSSP